MGGVVMVVNGRGRGCKATLMALHEDRYCCDIQMKEGILQGRLINNVEYEDISRLAEA